MKSRKSVKRNRKTRRGGTFNPFKTEADNKRNFDNNWKGKRNKKGKEFIYNPRVDWPSYFNPIQYLSRRDMCWYGEKGDCSSMPTI